MKSQAVEILRRVRERERATNRVVHGCTCPPGTPPNVYAAGCPPHEAFARKVHRLFAGPLACGCPDRSTSPSPLVAPPWSRPAHRPPRRPTGTVPGRSASPSIGACSATGSAATRGTTSTSTARCPSTRGPPSLPAAVEIRAIDRTDPRSTP